MANMAREVGTGRWCMAAHLHVVGRPLEPLACRRPRQHDRAMKSRVHPTYKARYRVGNWRVYERALEARIGGSGEGGGQRRRPTAGEGHAAAEGAVQLHRSSDGRRRAARRCVRLHAQNRVDRMMRKLHPKAGAAVYAARTAIPESWLPRDLAVAEHSEGTWTVDTDRNDEALLRLTSRLSATGDCTPTCGSRARHSRRSLWS